MSQKTSYAIFLSFMALFAALAANAKEPAAAERAAVLSAVGNQTAYAKALEAYDRKLTRIFAPKPGKGIIAKAKAKARKTVARPKAIAHEIAPKPEVVKAEPVKAEPVEQPIGKPVEQAIDQSVDKPIGPPSGQPIAVDHSVDRAPASDSTSAAIEEATAQTEAAASTISSSAM